ncbi:MAG: alginate export family protein [Nitrospiraceae bacterium]|nr:alginate export family protein [Nitrospiraceae bacterium]
MRTQATAVLLAIFVLAGFSATAELQNVVVGGQITVEGDYWGKTIETRNDLRWGAGSVARRPVGWGPGSGVFSWTAFDDTDSWSQITQRTRLHVKAGFTDNVSAFIELESVDTWGEDFRSNYVTGVDARGASVDDVEVYQAYVDLDELFGQPLRVRIGRQELSFGNGWLLGTNESAPIPFAWGLSYDALRLTYAVDAFSVDAFWAKLQESGPVEEDGDVDLYGIYGSYYPSDDIVLDAYWLLVRDGRAIQDTNLGFFGEWVEDWLGVDDYDVTNLHTVGIRAAGEWRQFDFDAEAAYQFGDAGQVGGIFIPIGYGDDDADFDSWGLDVELGYTFDTRWQPRVYGGYAYLQGEDNRDISFWDWLNPFYMPTASVSFNRLFSDRCYSQILDASDLSNLHIFTLGMEAAPTDKLWVGLVASYFLADEVFDAPAHLDLGYFLGQSWRIPLAPNWSFWTSNNDDEIGWEVGLDAAYAYSEDLEFGVGWYHFFTGGGAYDGSFISSNGLDFAGGRNDDDADYVYWYVEVGF